MSAATGLRRVNWRGLSHPARQGVTKALRGSHWYPGWIIAAHNDRLMAYPTGGYDSAVTVANGGPLPVPGADGNGGLRIIARAANVNFILANGVVSEPTVAVVIAAGIYAITVTATVASHTAAAVVAAIRSHALAYKLIDITATGTGLGLVATFAETIVPHVRLFGVARSEVDVSDQTSADVALDTLDPSFISRLIETGELGLLYASAPPVPCEVEIEDNQTMSIAWAPLRLQTRCVDVEDGLAYCQIG